MKRKSYVGIDFSGKKFGRLLVVGKSDFGRTTWHCKCDCGAQIDLHASRLLTGQLSCGCLREECKEKFAKENTTHDGSYSRLYKIWQGMRNRCYKAWDSSYKNYGAKGITVCDDWNNSFASFREWAVSSGYVEGLDKTHQSIDRIDGTKGYSPDNCRWATAKEQQDNRSVTTFYDYHGRKITASEFADNNGIYDKSFVYRRVKCGVSLDEILEEWNIKHNTPSNLQKLSDYAAEEGISTVAAARRVRLGLVKGKRAGKYWYVLKGEWT